MSVTHANSHIDAIEGPPSPPIAMVIAAVTGATVASTVASLIPSIPAMPDWLIVPVIPVAGAVDAPNPRSAHSRLTAKAIPAHSGRDEALATLVATDTNAGRTVSET